MHLFKKNIFSISSPTYSTLKDKERDILISILKTNYPALRIEEITQIGAFEINSNNFKLVTSEGTFILKRSSIAKLERLSAQAEWTLKLALLGFPTLHFLKNKDNQLISVEGQFIYCLSFYEKGLYFGTSENDWPDLMLNLKKLYDHCLNNLHSNTHIPERTFYTKEDDSLMLTIGNADKIKNISKVEREQIITEYERTKKVFLDGQKKYNKAIFHVDIHPHNLIFKNNKLLLLTDFESYQITYIEISLGFGLYKCLRQIFAIKEDRSKQEKQALLAEFERQFYISFSNLNFKELITLAKADVIKRLSYILDELLKKGESQWLFVLQTQLTALEEISEIEKMLPDH